jgi:hypothetical protein
LSIPEFEGRKLYPRRKEGLRLLGCPADLPEGILNLFLPGSAPDIGRIMPSLDSPPVRSYDLSGFEKRRAQKTIHSSLPAEEAQVHS